MSLVPYSSIETTVDLSNTNSRFYSFKVKIVKGISNYFSNEIRFTFIYRRRHFRMYSLCRENPSSKFIYHSQHQGAITDLKEIAEFVNSELLDLIKLIFART